MFSIFFPGATQSDFQRFRVSKSVECIFSVSHLILRALWSQTHPHRCFLRSPMRAMTGGRASQMSLGESDALMQEAGAPTTNYVNC